MSFDGGGVALVALVSVCRRASNGLALPEFDSERPDNFCRTIRKVTRYRLIASQKFGIVWRRKGERQTKNNLLNTNCPICHHHPEAEVAHVEEAEEAGEAQEVASEEAVEAAVEEDLAEVVLEAEEEEVVAVVQTEAEMREVESGLAVGTTASSTASE